MELIQAKIRGLGSTMESCWFTLGPQLNLFHFPDTRAGSNFLRALATINPPYSCHATQPFQDFPRIIHKEGVTRRIFPEKRTIAFSVFSATPKLVEELAAISPLLYATDRVEVGRRLDYSRWIGFVELALSTRWSEVATPLQQLCDWAAAITPAIAARFVEICRDRKPSDRIKNELRDTLIAWMHALPSLRDEPIQHLFDTTMQAILRIDHFHAAQEWVKTRLPLFAVLGRETDHVTLREYIAAQCANLRQQSLDAERTFLADFHDQLSTLGFPEVSLSSCAATKKYTIADPCAEESDGSAQEGTPAFLRQLQLGACLASALSRTVYKANPILLFDAPERNLPQSLHGQLADFVVRFSQHTQCLYVYNHALVFSQDAADKSYESADLVDCRSADP
jgi:hypothetical protein